MIKSDYFGKDFSDLQLDYVCLRSIPQELTKKEPSLYDKKWWDYRDLHPMGATYNFVYEYNRAYKNIASKRIETKKVQIFEGDFLLRPESVIRGFWLGRQVADELSMPYNFYCYYTIDTSEKMDWPYLARPEDMSNTALVTETFNQWTEYTKHVTVYPKTEGYKIANPGYYYDAFLDALKSRVDNKINKKPIIDHCLAKNFFDLDFVNNNFK
jgi:hypothetical protein